MGLVIPIFISHRGCPHQCLFCNQRVIAGTGEDAWPDVAGEIRTWLSRSRTEEEVQVAFYGGSFTCLGRELQERLLAPVQPFLEAGVIGSIRVSTRPDCITEENCRFLKQRGVVTVELGVQSLDDRVLAHSRRGHDAGQSRRAMMLLREAGLAVGVQLLPGLPGETTCSFLAGVKEVARFKPELVRLYPAVVVAGSELATLYGEGRYRPLSLNRAIGLTRRAREILTEAGVTVARMGLQPSESLAASVLAGPYHPSFGELVISRQWFRELRLRLAACPQGGRLTVKVAERDLSALVGMKKMNIKRLAALGLLERCALCAEKDRERGRVEYVVS